MEWRVGLEHYEVMAAHGFYDEEHRKPQPFVFTVWAKLGEQHRIESLEQTLNYADIQIAIDAVMLEAHEPIRLMEDMAQQIIDRLSANSGVVSIRIRIQAIRKFAEFTRKKNPKATITLTLEDHMLLTELP